VEQAATIVLVDIEGFSVEEAAAILDVPTGTVKSRCARARARLAQQLHELDPRRQQDPSDRNDGPGSRVQTNADTSATNQDGESL
jgi:RNA polymerase sigma-70 factor (ECF subfamily)